MRLYSMLMLGVYLRLNMGYFEEWNYLNKASSSLLDLCCLSLSTCEMKLLLLLCILIAIAIDVVYKSSSHKSAEIGGSSKPLEPPLVTGLYSYKDWAENA